MAINLSNKVSEADKSAVRRGMEDHDYRDGFGEEDLSSEEDDYSSFFDSIDSSDDTFGGFGTEDNNNYNNGESSNSNNGFGDFGGLGDGVATNVFGQQQQQQEQPKEKDSMDNAIDVAIDSTKKTYQLMKEIVNSAMGKTADDFAFFGTSLIKIGAVIDVVSIIALIIGKLSGVGKSYINLFGNYFVAGTVNMSLGMIALGTSALILGRVLVNEPNRLDDIEPLEKNEDNKSDDIDNIDDFDSLFDFEDDDEDDEDVDNFDSFYSSNDADDKSKSEQDTNDFMSSLFGESYEEENEDVDYNEALENVRENSYITRKTLVDTFVPMLRRVTPNFNKKTEVDKDSDTYITIDTICKKVIANLFNCNFEDIEDDVETLNETVYSYEIYFKRTKKINKLTDIEKELEAYFRSNSTDKSVVANVDIEGDFYRMVVSKGETSLITIGDVLGVKEYREFFEDESHKLPIISGITNMGVPILDDAKVFDSMVIAGKPRSGKSWYLFSIIMTLAMFNTPEQVQFVLVDPKKTNMFKQLANLPHVCGLHDHSNIIDLFDDIIENEAPRRKKLLSDNRCDDIWALWDKGITVPILYLVLDEYLTIKNSLGDSSKELDSRLQILISQLPYLGIRVLFIPHRTTGIVDKTNRTMLQFKAAVRADTTEIKDTLDIQKWDKPLINLGDTALKTSQLSEAVQVRSAVLATNDSEMSDFIRVVAKAFYKMGVDVPDMSEMRIACNRDPEAVREDLSGEKLTEQFNANNWDD